jgi:hypothetical protein
MRKFPANDKHRQMLINNTKLQECRETIGLPHLKDRVRKWMKCEQKFITIYPNQYICCNLKDQGFEEYTGIEDSFSELDINV